MEYGPAFVLLPGPEGVSGKLPRARIRSYLPCSLSLPPHPLHHTLGPLCLVISTELERKSDPSLIVRNVDLMWPQGERSFWRLQRPVDGVACTGAGEIADCGGLGVKSRVSIHRLPAAKASPAL